MTKRIDLHLDPSQELAVDLVCSAPLGVVTGGPGCHRRGQKLLRSDGTFVAVEDVRVGERLAGHEGQTRTVLALRSGFGAMARVVPVKGASFVVNIDHVLTVVHSCTNEVTDVTVRDYLGWVAKRRDKSKLFRQPFDFEIASEHRLRPQPAGLPPYVVGVLLGDGCLSNGPRASFPDEEIAAELRQTAFALGLDLTQLQTTTERCPVWCFAGTPGRENAVTAELRRVGLAGTRSAEKFVPFEYKIASRADRLELLAGLIDTDGHLANGNTFDFISKSPALADDLVFVARSVGLAAYLSRCEKYCQTGAGGTYWRVCLSGDVDMVPTRVPRKRAAPRRQKKNVLRTGFTVETLPDPEPFYGFTLDGDGRYLLDDFTVTHNTGKTTCMRVALDRLERRGLAVRLASPTGKAARRLEEATGRAASTLHRLLEYHPAAPPPHFLRTAQNPLECDLVVVDETSMLDVELADALLSAVQSPTRLIFVGDADQLPSVGPGRVFADLITSGRVPVARLTTLHRAAAESWVCSQAPEVLAGRPPDLRARPDFMWVEQSDRARAVEALIELVTGTLPRSGVTDAQVLVPQNVGPAGAELLNRVLQGALNTSAPGSGWKVGRETELRVGDRVIQTRNDYQLQDSRGGQGVFNGEVGRVARIDSEAGWLTVDYGDGSAGRTAGVDTAASAGTASATSERLVHYDRERVGSLALAYALTGHRAQGSEWPWVVVLVHSTHTRMLTRQWLYTAITRARQGVVIVGDRLGIDRAVKNVTDARRNTSLVERLAMPPTAAPPTEPT